MSRLGHVHLPVADLERSLAFYGGLLGFEVEYRDERMAYLPEAGLILDLVDDGDSIGGGTVLGLRCDDADEVFADLAARGAPLADPPEDRPWGVRNFYLTDPDGHDVEYEQALEAR
jgi:catechol 2,3-dioxygenase-like lactoylglutathione lyase family enzyme